MKYSQIQKKNNFMNYNQIRGIAIIIFSISGYVLLDNNIMQTLAGVLCAVGLGYIVKWLPIKKQKS